MLEKVTELMTGATDGIVIVSVGAGDGVTLTPAALSVAVSVMVPAVVPVSSTGGFGKTAVVVPAGMLKVRLVKLPAFVKNVTSVGLPPTADWKVTDNVPVRATGKLLARDKVTDGCVAAVPGIVPMVSAGVGGRLTVMEMGEVAVSASASVTFSVMFVVPVAVGVPLMTPPLNWRPAGRVPEEIDQV